METESCPALLKTRIEVVPLDTHGTWQGVYVIPPKSQEAFDYI